MTDTFTACQSRIRKVLSVYNDLYDAREEGSTERRKLELHEALFLSAVNAIDRESAKERADAQRVWGYRTNAYEALCNLSWRNEAAKMEAALQAYRNEQERFENGDDEEALEAAE